MTSDATADPLLDQCVIDYANACGIDAPTEGWKNNLKAYMAPLLAERDELLVSVGKQLLEKARMEVERDELRALVLASRPALEAGAEALHYENRTRILDDKMRLRNLDCAAQLRTLSAYGVGT